MAKRLALEGKVFGKLTVISYHSNNKGINSRYLCSCTCGKTSIVLSSHLVRGNTKSCGCGVVVKGKEDSQWKGAGDISAAWWCTHVKRYVKSRRVIPIEITIEEAWQVFLKQNRKCALSGQHLKFPESSSDKTGTASLDRIDSSKSYQLSNIQWVHKHINIMKNKFEQEYFIDLCRQIVEYKK